MLSYTVLYNIFLWKINGNTSKNILVEKRPIENSKSVNLVFFQDLACIRGVGNNSACTSDLRVFHLYHLKVKT